MERFFPACGDPRILHPFPTRRSSDLGSQAVGFALLARVVAAKAGLLRPKVWPKGLSDMAPLEVGALAGGVRSEEHTSELQSQSNLVCRLLLEKKNGAHARDRP